MISHKHNCIFTHIPKCGGTSIENMIWGIKNRTEQNLWMGFISKYHNKYQTGGLQHLLSRHIKEEVGEQIYSGYYKFCIVRNPWDKAVSQYAHMTNRTDLRNYIGMKKNDCFKTYLELINKRKHVQWEQQIKFVRDHNGNCLVDYIGRFENFETEVKTIMSKLNIQFNNIPHEMKGNRTHYKDYYDTESIQMIEELYTADINAFSYSYE